MKKFTKALSVVLAVMMIMCTVTALSFSASAAEANKVSLTSNVGDTVSYDYSADSTQVTVTYKLQSNILIENIQAVASYDSSVLKLASSNTTKSISPVFYGTTGAGYVANLKLNNMIKFNATNIDGYDFTKGATVFTAVFDIVGTGSTAVDFDIYVLTGIQNEKDVRMVYRDEIINKNFTVTASGKVAGYDVPTDGYYVVGDSFNLKLATCGTGKMSGTIALQPGTYEFKLKNGETLLGYGKTVTDTTNGLTFKSTYSSFCKLIATGGVYTFQVNTSTNTLVIKHNSNLPNEYLIGDLTTVLSPVEGKTLSVGSVYLTKGEYSFKLSIGAEEYGYGKTVTDTTNGASLSFNKKYSASLKLIATGGTYTFTLNTATNRLQISCASSAGEADDDVHISGEGINLVLNDNGGASNVATGTIKLSEGNYAFKVYNYGVAYTAGAKIVDSAVKNLKSSNTASVTLIASGGTYSFSFNKTTGQLTVSKA